MSDFVIKLTCYHCKGSGEVPDYPDSGGNPPLGTETCPVCNGVQTIEAYSIDLSDIIDKLDDIIDKCNDIFEKVNE